MTLILWKAPVVKDADEAQALLKPYYDREDDSAFEPSADLALVANELLRRFPAADSEPWADPMENTGRVLMIHIRWAADNAVIDAVVELAHQHELVYYDPQAPDVLLPGDPIDSGPTPPPRLIDYLKIAGLGLVAAGVFWLGWRIDVPVLDWVLMIVGGFFVSVIVFLFVLFMFGPKEDTERRPSA